MVDRFRLEYLKRLLRSRVQKLDSYLIKMQLPLIITAATLLLSSSSQAINILLNNDDGFGSGNLRETYRLLKEKGHNGISYAP